MSKKKTPSKPSKSANYKGSKGKDSVKEPSYEVKPFPLTKEQMIKALEQTYGNVSKACQLYSYDDGTPIKRCAFLYWMEKWDIPHYPKVVKKEIAKQALDKLREVAILQGNVKALTEILDRWGHLIEFSKVPSEANLTVKGDPFEQILMAVDPERARAAGIVKEEEEEE